MVTQQTSWRCREWVAFAVAASCGSLAPFRWRTQGQRLMLVDLAGGRPIEIFNGSSVYLPVWSPDGSAIIITMQLVQGKTLTELLPK